MIWPYLLAIVVTVFALTAFVGAPYVPSHRKNVARAFRELRPLDDSDVVVDLGSGDGVVLREALGAGAGRVIGYEINPFLVWISRLRLERGRSWVTMANMWTAQPPEGVTVVYAFSVDRDTRRLTRLVQSWADSVGRPIDFIIYAHELPDIPVTKNVGAHHLYRFSPL